MVFERVATAVAAVSCRRRCTPRAG